MNDLVKTNSMSTHIISIKLCNYYSILSFSTLKIFSCQNEGQMEYYAPPLTDQDFNKQVGRYSQSIFQRNSSRVLTATHIGNLVVWDNNKPLTKCKSEAVFAHTLFRSIVYKLCMFRNIIWCYRYVQI